MLSLSSCLLFGCAATFLLYFLWNQRRRLHGKGELPPGPAGWPLLGNISSVANSDRHRQIYENGKRYGGIFTMRLGASQSVWVTSYKIFREAMVENSWTFAGRPHGIWMKDDTTDKNPGILSSGVDDAARNIRKFTLITLRSFGFGKTSMQDAILQESDDLNDEFSKRVGESFNPRDIIATAAANVISSMSLGRTYKQGDEGLRLVNDTITHAVRQVLKAQRDKAFPFLRYVPFLMGSRKDLDDSFQKGKQFIMGIIKDHTLARDVGVPRDFVDVWLDESEKSEQAALDFPTDRLPNILLDLFAGGFETTTTTFQWIFAMLLHHPEVQERIHSELDSKVGHGVQITLESRDSVPYTESVILETLRLYPLVPFGIPHQATEDAHLAGYRIPKGTQVMLHLYSILNDTDLWDAPEEFRPERFLQDGAIKIPDYYVPFGAGRRSCIGEQLARKELFLLFANIMRSFRIVLPDGESLPSLELMQSVVMYPRPFNIRLEER